MVNPDTGPRQTGAPVDAVGRFAADPTANVRELVIAAMTRQDDLREFEEKLTAAYREGLIKWVSTELEAIRHEFTLVESRRQEQKVDTKTAVDAALSAAKDAVKEQAAASEKAILKSETSSGEQSKQNATNFSSQMTSVTLMLADAKERISKIENIKQGGDDSRSNNRLDLSALIGVGGFLIAVALAIITILKR